MYFISYIDRVNISVAGPIIRKEWNLSQTELGFVFSAFAYPYAAMQIFGGWLADKFGPRLILTVLSVIWGAATLLCGFATALPMLIVLRFLLGVGEGGAFPTATRAFTYWMPVAERGFAQGITHSFARLGGALAPMVVVWIVLARGWRASFVILGCVSVAWTALWLLVFRNTPAEHRWVKEEELREIGVDAAQMRAAAKGATPWRSMLERMWLSSPGRLLLRLGALGLPRLAALVSEGGARLRATGRSTLFASIPLFARRRRRHPGRRHLRPDPQTHQEPQMGAERRPLGRPLRRVRLHRRGDVRARRRGGRRLPVALVLLPRADQRRALEPADRHRGQIRRDGRRDDEQRLRDRGDDLADLVRLPPREDRTLRGAVRAHRGPPPLRRGDGDLRGP